jgi:hypothetical protein
MALSALDPLLQHEYLKRKVWGRKKTGSKKTKTASETIR